MAADLVRSTMPRKILVLRHGAKEAESAEYVSLNLLDHQWKIEDAGQCCSSVKVSGRNMYMLPAIPRVLNYLQRASLSSECH